MELKRLYEKLLEKHGRQNWWPAESRYEVVVGAVLTQNTNWKNVEKALGNLKKENVLEEKQILEITQERLEELIKPSGFYRQKAERLKLVTKKWIEIKNSSASTEQLRKELLSVKGIGKETADSILLYALNRKIFVIDAYTRRFVKAELGREFVEYDDYRSYFESCLPSDLELYKEYHALIVEWGKNFKVPRHS